MTERQFYKKVYQLIFVEGKSHQEVYAAEEKESRLGPESVARTISMVPSREKYQTLKGLLTLFVGSLLALALLRIVAIFAFGQLEDMSTWNMIFAATLVVFCPLMGVLGAMQAKPTLMAMASLFVTVCIIRGFFSEDFGSDIILYVSVALGVAAYIGGTMIPRKMRVGYNREVIEKEKDGKMVKRVTYSFDESVKMSRKEVFKENF